MTFKEQFAKRHLGLSAKDAQAMLQLLGCQDMQEFINQVVPSNIRLKADLNLPQAVTETEYLAEIRQLSQENQVFTSYLGQGHYNNLVPSVILRNIFENPCWYTQYTPYQPEISQGRLEALLNFQTLVQSLTAMEVSNASLLDEATAAAEAMTMSYRLVNRRRPKPKTHYFVAEDCFEATKAVLQTRAEPLGIQLVLGATRTLKVSDSFFGGIAQYPNATGEVYAGQSFVETIHHHGGLATLATDLLGLCLLQPPGEWGADIVVGSAQRLGVPLGFGGPHPAFFATKQAFVREVPGRIIGVSVDKRGNQAYRMALQTREQHIKRERATSNICTSQALLAIMSSFYAVYHGAKGLMQIATKIHQQAAFLEQQLTQQGFKQLNPYYFDTLHLHCQSAKQSLAEVRHNALQQGYNLRYLDDQQLTVSLDETTTPRDLHNLCAIFGVTLAEPPELPTIRLSGGDSQKLPSALLRQSEYLTEQVFNRYHSETEMLRYMQNLASRDLSLTTAMIPLGSCTMKLNATTEMMPLSWPEFSNLHPFAPLDQAKGYQQIIGKLAEYLAEITGLPGVSFQPNSGAQGEYTGLRVINAYHQAQGQQHRNVVLIPASAHGTNPASATMCGMQVVVVNCDKLGNVDLEDLKAKTAKHKDRLASFMITYPSTHGVYEEAVQQVCQIIHDAGGLVYLDGANMNAQVGLTRPKEIGADVCHLNLHKTFSIPHGGGGPGMGPICVSAKLTPFLPNHPSLERQNPQGISAVSGTAFGSASILLISYGYIRLLGQKGCRQASEVAILNANYIKQRLQEHYPILYAGQSGRGAHEFILDTRGFKATTKVEATDIAKRLMDYCFHAPTISFPVANTMMVEPTESESKAELDRFCEALIAIRQEIREIEQGQFDSKNNLLKNAPHTVQDLVEDWQYPYSRERAVYPLKSLKRKPFWSSVSRVDEVYGDRNPLFRCPS